MPRQINEERTRKEMIDPQLERAGWYLRARSETRTVMGLIDVFMRSNQVQDAFSITSIFGGKI